MAELVDWLALAKQLGYAIGQVRELNCEEVGLPPPEPGREEPRTTLKILKVDREKKVITFG